MRRRVAPFIMGLCLLAAPHAAAASSPVRVQASVGFSNQYRNGPQWVPVVARVTDTGNSVLTGEVVVRGNTEASETYTQPVDLYPGTTKEVTLYVPAVGVGNSVTIAYRAGGHSLGEALAYPQAIPNEDLLVGTLTDDPGAVSWLRRAATSPRAHVVTLSPTNFPTAPEALAELDALVFTNVDTSRLDSAQIAGLRSYVQNGGSLLLVGGPDWQATLGGLPRDLLPGTPSGLRAIHRMPVPRFLGMHDAPTGKLGVTAVSAPRGVVLLAAGTQALIVKETVGNGLVDYLAFDPSLAPLAGWSGVGEFTSSLLANATPQSERRLPLDPADRSTSYLFPGSQPMALGAELANIPSPALSLVLGLLLLLLGALLIIGATVVITRRVRPGFAPVVIPLAVLLSAGSLIEVTPAFARSRAIVNTLSFVRLDAHGPAYPATVYAGLVAPLAGRYRIDYPYPALATNLSALYPGPYWDGGTTVSEGATTEMNLGQVGLWAVRAVALRTTVAVPGRVTIRLRLSRTGTIVGTIHNDTALTLREPVLIAGRSFTRLRDIAAHTSIAVSLVPSADPQERDYVPMLTRIYGRPLNVGNGIPAVSPFGTPSDMPEERTISDRIRDAVDTLPETNLMSVLGEVTLAAWTDASIAPLTVNGSRVQQRDLALLVEPISALSIPSGPLRIRAGTLGAEMLSVQPATAPYECCGVTAQPISFGPGGSASFAFSIPQRMHVSSLRLHLYAGGSDPSASGYQGVPGNAVSAYDWHAGGWTHLAFRNGAADLSRPGRFVSPDGSFVVQLVARGGGDLSILDAHQDLQLEVTGRRQ